MKPFALMLISILAPAAFGEGGAGRAAEEGTVYVPIGKRDPFRVPTVSDDLGQDVATLNPLERFNVDQFILRAILRGTNRAQAMFEDPEGRVHIVTEGTIIGRERGTISRILNREVIVTERTVNYLGVQSLYERVLSLPPDDMVDQGTNVPAAGGGGAAGGTNKAGGGARGDKTEADQLNPELLRALTQERAAPPAPPPPPPPAAPELQLNRTFNTLQNNGAPAAPPPATFRGGGGDGKNGGLVY